MNENDGNAIVMNVLTCSSDMSILNVNETDFDSRDHAVDMLTVSLAISVDHLNASIFPNFVSLYPHMIQTLRIILLHSPNDLPQSHCPVSLLTLY